MKPRMYLRIRVMFLNFKDAIVYYGKGRANLCSIHGIRNSFLIGDT